MGGFSFEDSAARLNLTPVGPSAWRGEHAGVRVEMELAKAAWPLVRFVAYVDPPLDVGLQAACFTSLDLPPSASLSEASFLLEAGDPERARALLEPVTAAIVDATRDHDWVGLYDRHVRLSSAQRGASRPTLNRDTHQKICESLDKVTRIARMLSDARRGSGPPIAAPSPPPAPRAVPRALMAAPRSLGWVGAGLVLLGACVAGPALWVGELDAHVLWVWIGAIVGAVGAVLAAVAVRMAQRRSSLYRDGAPALAHVVSVASTTLGENRHRLWRYTFEYPDGAERRHRGHALAIDPPHVGERVWIVYRPSEPGRAMPFPRYATLRKFRCDRRSA